MKRFSKDICKNVFGLDLGWIRSLIKLAYDKCLHHLIQLSAAKLHEVGALSASLAWRANIGLLSDILLAQFDMTRDLFARQQGIWACLGHRNAQGMWATVAPKNRPRVRIRTKGEMQMWVCWLTKIEAQAQRLSLHFLFIAL